MASLANELLQHVTAVTELALSAATAEKARVALIKAEAASMFASTYATWLKMQSVSNSSSGQGSVANHAELQITLAEAAYVSEAQDTARLLLERFLQLAPQEDQYFCRAKILLGRIIDYEAGVAGVNGNESIKQRKLALAEILAALTVATAADNAPRYKFLVFNASVACWQVVSPFLRENRARFFVKEMSTVSGALEACDEGDKFWRIKFLSATAICYDDEKKGSKEASDCVDKAIEHLEKILSQTLEVESKILVEVKQFTTESENIMSAVRKVEEREEALSKPPKIDPDWEEGMEVPAPEEIPPLTGLSAQFSIDELREKLNDAQVKKKATEELLSNNNTLKTGQQERLGRLYMSRVLVNPADSKKMLSMPQVSSSLRIRVLVQLQCLTSGCIPDKEWPATFEALVKDLEAAPASAIVTETLLDVCRVAWTLGTRDVAIQCSEKAEHGGGGASITPVVRVKLDLCKALGMVADIALQQQASSQLLEQRLSEKEVEGWAISRRVEAIKLLERTLTLCVGRLGAEEIHNTLQQEICIAIWNTCLPLFQPHLRAHAHQALQLAANALAGDEQSGGGSTLALLRSQIHFELAKCEEQGDFVSKAQEEALRSLGCDYGTLDEDKKDPEIDRNRKMDHLVRPMADLLGLRSSLYDTPSDVEGQVFLMLQQIKESSSRQFQADMLEKAAKMMLYSLQRSSSPRQLPETTLENLREALNVSRTASPPTSFTQLTQQQVIIMSTIAQLAQAQRNVPVLQAAACVVLSFSWDVADPFVRPFILAQIDMHFLITDSLVEQLSKLWIDEEQERAMEIDQVAKEAQAQADGTTSSEIPDPRSMGIVSPYASPDMNLAKEIVILCLNKSTELSTLIKDELGVQNSIIYFWNLHLHLFRNYKLYAPHVTDEVLTFLNNSLTIMAGLSTTAAAAAAAATPALGTTIPGSTPTQLDERLKIALIEGLSRLLEATGKLPQAAEAAAKGCVGTGSNSATSASSAYIRRKICELTCRLTMLAAAAPPAAGGKAAAAGKAPDPPKFDHPLLNVYGALALAELPAPTAENNAQIAAQVDRAIGLMEGEVAAYLSAQDWPNMTQEIYDRLLEMQAECWTRLTRAKIVLGDMHGSQMMATRCMDLVVAEGMMNEADERKLSPRVWRWVSMCERYFGIAIQQIIQPEGQDAALQNELRLAALRHFTLACNYALRASKENLLVSASINAWNISIALVDVSAASVRMSLSYLQRQVVDSLLSPVCREDNEEAAVLRQQFYLAMIDGQAQGGQWDEALKIVFEAFEHVPVSLQKPLWKWRVIALSKKGKNVLDGIQKLKEGDASLQARVYGILARASSNPKQQLEAYRKTMEILKEDMERVDYMLETGQWMASAGVPRAEVMEVVRSALDAVYEVEEKLLLDNGPEKIVDDGSVSASGSVGSKNSSRSKRSASKSGASGRKSSTSAHGGGGGSRRASSSRRSSKQLLSALMPTEEEGSGPQKLRVKQLEQAVRALIMMAMLESISLQRQVRCVECIYFVHRFLEQWLEGLRDTTRLLAYSKLLQSEREETPFEFYTLPETAYEGLSMPILNGIDLLNWIPSPAFASAQALAMEQMPTLVPSVTSLQNLPLTIHYVLWVATTLESFGFSKHALLCLGWARAILLFVPADNKEAAFAALYYRSVSIMNNCGLSEEASALASELGNTGVNCRSYLIAFGKTPIDPTAIFAPEISNSEQLSVFGFSSWTLSISKIDTTACMLEVCEDLINLGQNSLCRGLAGALRRDFLLEKNERGYLRTVAVLAQLDFHAGRLSEVLSVVLAAKPMMMNVGDGELLARHMTLSVSSYLRIGRPDEASRVLADALQVLNMFSLIALPNKAAGGSTPQVGGISTPHVGGGGSVRSLASNTISERGGRFGGIGGGGGLNKSVSTVIQTENSLEVVRAMVAVVCLFVDVLLAEGFALIQANKDPSGIYEDICIRIQRQLDLCICVAGAEAPLCATLYEKRSQAGFALLTRLQTQGGSGVDKSWIDAELLVCVDMQSKAVDIRRGVMSKIPLSELTFTRVAPPPPPPVVDAAPAKGKAKEVAPVPVVTKAEDEIILLSLPIVRSTAFAELELSGQYIALARLRGDQIPSPVVLFPTSGTAVDKFMFSTIQPTPFSAADFQVPFLHKAAQLASSVSQLLAKTEFESDGQLALVTASVMTICGAGGYKGEWPSDSVPFSPVVKNEEGVEEQNGDKEEEEAPQQEMSAASAEARNLLISAMQSVLASSRVTMPSDSLTPNYTPMVAAAAGASALVEALGAGRMSSAGEEAPGGAAAVVAAGAGASVCWLLVLQSIKMREWLFQCWTSALNPCSEISSTLYRLMHLDKVKRPSSKAQPQVVVDLAFLKVAVPAWKRLDISADPAQILSQAPAGTYFLSLQMCPLMQTMYVAAGKPSGAAAGAYSCSGSWCLDKLALSEESRKMLITLRAQHKLWSEDANKFVAIYGESVSADQDIVGVESISGGKLFKTERALEERLRALVSDLERIVVKILGEHSIVRQFLATNTAQQADAAAASLVLLIDPSLQSLPWEALSVTSLFAGGVGRDFSIHLFGHRLSSFSTGPNAPVVCESSSVKTVCDPYGDDTGSKIEGLERQAISQVMTKLAENVVGVTKWTPVCAGNGAALSSYDWLSATIPSAPSKKTSFFAYTPGRLGSLLAPVDLACLDLQNVLLFVVSDQGFTDASFRRQNGFDNIKQPREIALENPLQMAALASLGGAGSLVLTTWGTTLAAQRRFVSSFWSALCGSKSGGAAAAGKSKPTVVSSLLAVSQEANLKPWIKLSRCSIGLGNITASES